MTADPLSEALEARPPGLREDPGAAPLRVPDGYELRRVPTPRPKPKTRRGRAKVPYSRHEWELIARWAPRFTYSRLGAEAYGEGAHSDPNRTFEDATFAWYTCAFMRGSSIHVSLVPRLNASDVYEDDHGLLRVRWPRAKTEHLQAPALLPREEFEPWVREYLDRPKPASDQAYAYLFDRLSDFIEQSTRTPREGGKPGEFEPGERIKLNALRFRHTALVRWLEPPFRFPPATVCQWGRTTLRTLVRYWNPEEPELAARLKASGLA